MAAHTQKAQGIQYFDSTLFIKSLIAFTFSSETAIKTEGTPQGLTTTNGEGDRCVYDPQV